MVIKAGRLLFVTISNFRESPMDIEKKTKVATSVAEPAALIELNTAHRTFTYRIQGEQFVRYFL